MSPPRREDDLQALTYRDFTSGLFERGNEREVPPNGLIECTDCMPLRNGGLRAAWAWKEESKTNLPRNRRVLGFQVQRGELEGERNRKLLEAGIMLASTSTAALGPFTYEYWFANSLSSAVFTTALTDWSSGRTHSSMDILRPVRFESFQGNWYYNVAEQLAATTQGIGVWRMPDLNTTAATQVLVSENIADIVAHQDRLLYAKRTNNRYHTIIFTSPSTDATPPSSNTLTFGTFRPGDITFMDAVFPQDLFILKLNHGGFVIQGDIGAGPLVRETVQHYAPERPTRGVRIPQGIAYLTQSQGVWLWAGGSESFHLSGQFTGSPMTEVTLNPTSDSQSLDVGFLGQLGFAGQWLFTPKGYIFDTLNGWWFKSTLPSPGIFSHWSPDLIGARMFGAGHTEPGDNLNLISASTDLQTMVRTGSFQATLPLIDTAERNVEVRRIEVFGQGFGNGGTWQLEITNDRGETETTGLAAVAARAGSARFNTKTTGDYLKIRLLSQGNGDASSPTGKSEAPMIDSIVVYVKPRQTRNT